MPLKRKIIMAVGGTGGHLFPAQALARQLRDNNIPVQVLFMGAGLNSSRYFSSREFPSIEIESATLFRRQISSLFPSFKRLLKGTWQSMRQLKKEKPALVIGFGSFHSFPVLMAATFCKVPFVLFESNVIPGKVNRLFSRWAQWTAVQFEEAQDKLKGKAVVAEMPLWDKDRISASMREDAARYFNLREDVTTILVFGGSQGARSINRLFCEAMQAWEGRPQLQIIHLTGDVTSCHEALLCYRRLGIPAQVKVFEDRMPLAWRIADFAICRAGAATMAELLAHRVPSLLIPYPYASDNHQFYNAQIMAQKIGGAMVIEEKNLSSDVLGVELKKILGEQGRKLKEMQQSITAFHQNAPRDPLFSLVEQMIEKTCYSH